MASVLQRGAVQHAVPHLFKGELYFSRLGCRARLGSGTSSVRVLSLP